jgi:hypothetical protein
MADAVTDWNAFIDTLPPQHPAARSRIEAMMQVAVHDALNSIEPRYESYSDLPRVRRSASPDAAVAAAARTVLVATLAASQVAINNFYNTAMAGCSSQSCLDGIAAGEAAANAILLARVGDGSATPHLPYNAPVAPGVFQPTPTTPGFPANNPPVQWNGWAHVTPFVMTSPSQFRAEPSKIFDLKSVEFTRDYNEVKRIGELNSTERTAEQSEIARFWPGGGANINAVGRAIIAGHQMDLWQHARLFALINMALHDSAVSVFDTKYTYTFWRPVTAIRAGDTDLNPYTVPDPAWNSYLNTPPYPDYTCGLTTQTGAGLEVLRRYFSSDELPYTLTAAGATRSFARLSKAEAEAVDARVFAGIHFRTGCARGITQGRQVGRFVIQHSLQLLKRGRGHDDDGYGRDHDRDDDHDGFGHGGGDFDRDHDWRDGHDDGDRDD